MMPKRPPAAGAHDKALAATWADTEDLRTAPATLWVYRAALAQARGDIPAIVRHARRALDLAGADDHFVAGPRPGSSVWPPGRPVTSRRPCRRSRRRFAACTRRGTWSTSWTAPWCSATCGSARVAPTGHAAVRAGPRDRDRAGEPYPRATADLHVGLAERGPRADDLSAQRNISRPRGCSASAARSPRTGTAGTSPWRRYASRRATTPPPGSCSTRPRNCTGPALPRPSPDRRHASPRGHRRGRPHRGRGVGARQRRRPR